MSWFRKSKPEPVAVDAFESWEIQSHLADGTGYKLSGHVGSFADPVEVLRYADAIADGLRRAGFDAEVTLTRKQEVKR
jgi:hypothetical protein